MTPTHRPDSPGDHMPEPNQYDLAAPGPLPRTRRLRTLRLALRHLRSPRPSTVWPCDQHELNEGTGLIANWLLTAVITIVTTYTRPGQRVLLLDPAPFIAPRHSWPASMARNWPRPGPYTGLLEANWAVIRIGRDVHAQTVFAFPNSVDITPGDPPAESQSGPGPHASPSTNRATGQTSHARPGPDATGHASERFDLIIAAAEPRTLDWFHPTDWAGLLAPTGTLAIITHGDHADGRLADPAGPLVAAAHHAGLRYHDRIALLRIQIRNSTLVVGPTSSPSLTRPAPHGPAAIGVRHTQAHDDLFVFTRQSSADGEESSDV